MKITIDTEFTIRSFLGRALLMPRYYRKLWKTNQAAPLSHKIWFAWHVTKIIMRNGPDNNDSGN